MPVSEGKFATLFSRMEGLLNWTATKNTKEWWFEEVRECDPRAFEAAIDKLAHGQKRPLISDFWATYHGIKKSYVREEKQYCGNCLDGWVECYIPHMRADNGEAEKLTAVARCSVCWQGDKTNTPKMDPLDASIEWVRDPKKYNASKDQAMSDYREHIRKLKEKSGFGRPNPAIEGDRNRHIENVEWQALKNEGIDPDTGEVVDPDAGYRL